jgi:hypothetical protein
MGAPPSPRPRRRPDPIPRRPRTLHAAETHASFHHLAFTRSSRPRPSRPSTALLSRAHRGRDPRVLPPRCSHALIAAATLASFHHVALTRSSRSRPARPSTTSRSRAHRGRDPRILPPRRRRPHPARPRPSRSPTASLSERLAASARAARPDVTRAARSQPTRPMFLPDPLRPRRSRHALPACVDRASSGALPLLLLSLTPFKVPSGPSRELRGSPPSRFAGSASHPGQL